MALGSKPKSYFILIGGIALLVVFSAIACRPEPPTILFFTAKPSEITSGESTVLKWSIEGATMVRLDQSIGDVAATGSMSLSPTKTIAYTLTATNAGGTVSKSVVVYVASPPPPAPDTKAPVISQVSASSESQTKALITWTTNETSTGEVEYGETADYGLVITSDNGPTTAHSITLSGLEANAIYHYRVKSKDEAGNEAVSLDYTFITPAPMSPYVLELQWSEWGRRTQLGVPNLGVASEKKYLFIKGSVRSNSRATLRGVLCTMNCWNGNTLVKSKIYVHGGPTLPGQVFDFDVETDDDPSVDKVTIEFADSLGQEIQLVEK